MLIHIKNITKVYNERCILDIPDFTFESNKRYAILGENGSGKSTLLRILAGSISSDSGKIESDVCDSIGYLPQFAYIFNMSVRKNIELTLVSSKKFFFPFFSKRKEINSIIYEKLKVLNLSELCEENGHFLSGGEKQRLAIARIIARPYKVLILDEPISATDIVGIELIENAISDYVKENNCTVIYSTHSPAQAIRFSDEVVFLNKGKIVEAGNTKDILVNTENDYIKHFLSYCSII